MLTRKHFEAVARILDTCQDPEPIRLEIIGRLADYFETENPQFDRLRFVKAATKTAGWKWQSTEL